MLDPRIAAATAAVESGGAKNPYQSIGPQTKYGQALGKYQVMPGSLADWSPKYLGRTVAPEEFLANPQLQDQLYNARMGEYVQKYGPIGAAKAWFAGEGGMNNPNASDGYNTVSQYADKFQRALGPEPQAQQPATSPGNWLPQQYQQMYADGATAQAPQPSQGLTFPNLRKDDGTLAQLMAMNQPPQLQAPQINYYRPGGYRG